MKNIVLIGMPGAGKSTVGVVLAKTLGFDFVDTDLLMQHETNKKLQELIDENGIEKFLQIEADVIKTLNCSSAVIATGGSAVFDESAMMHLKENGLVVFIDVDYDEIAKRVKNITTRGIAKAKDKSLLDVYNERMPLYRKYADLTIDATNKNTEDIVREIKGLCNIQI